MFHRSEDGASKETASAVLAGVKRSSSPRRRATQMAALIAGVALIGFAPLAACGTSGGSGGGGGGAGSTTTSTTTGTGAITHPTGENEVVLQIRTGGGFVPIDYDYTNLPEFSLYGDGRVIVTGPVLAIYPGPALPNLQTTHISEESLQAILEAADDAGLFDPTFDYGQPGVADAPTTSFLVDAEGATHKTQVYALGFGSDGSGLTEEQQKARAGLDELRNNLAVLSAFTPDPPSWIPYEYTALAVYSQAVDPSTTASTDIMPNRLDWPLGDLATLGEEVQGGFRKVVVSGQDLLSLQQKPPLEKATQITLWKSGDRKYHLLFRPLLPEQTS